MDGRREAVRSMRLLRLTKCKFILGVLADIKPTTVVFNRLFVVLTGRDVRSISFAAHSTTLPVSVALAMILACVPHTVRVTERRLKGEKGRRRERHYQQYGDVMVVAEVEPALRHCE